MAAVCVILSGNAIPLMYLFLYQYAGIHCHHVVCVSQQRVDVHFLDFRSKAEERGQANNDFRILILVDTLL